MDQSLNDSQKSRVTLLSKGNLLQLYQLEYNTKYLSDIFGAFLPTDEQVWAEQMASIQARVAQRNAMTNNHDIHESVARVMFLIIKGHKLVDGNKRSSILCMVGLYLFNDYEVMFDPETLYVKVKELAALDSQTIDDEKEIIQLKEFLQQGTETVS